MTAPAVEVGRSRFHAPLPARPLSESITALLRDGDLGARYASRSEAVMATALAAASAGWTQTGWRDVLRDSALGDWAPVQLRKTGGRRPRNPADAERRLATTWRKAERRVLERPPAADHLSVRAELAELLAAADTDPGAWAGAAGVTDRAVLAALVDVAAAAATLTPSASTRQLAEAANVSAGTAAVALHRLAGRGWLRLEHSHQGTQAATWRLIRPAAAPAAPAALDAVLEQLPPRPTVPTGGSARAHDTFAHTIHGGLGRVAARIFDALDDGAYGGLSVGQLAVLTGLHPRTVIRHLIGLQATGLASCGGRGASWARSTAAADPDQLPAALSVAADLLGSTGATARRRARHALQREGFTAYWTDFCARRGWRVQRGLYRPDQPQLPLSQAA